MKRAVSLILSFIFIISLITASAEGDYSIMPLFQTDISEVEANIAGGTRYLSDSSMGKLSREKLVAELTDHENDKYYINTPYHRSDWQSPYGDNSYNGSTSMNCCGFVCYVLRKCGLSGETAIKYIKQSKDHATATGNLPYDLISKASNYYELVKEADLIAYAFESKSEMLNSGKCAKGDIILMYVNSPYGLDYGEDNHIGFFWGDSSSDDKFWHSSVKNSGGNNITKITESTAVYLLIKIDGSDVSLNPEGGFETYIAKSTTELRSGAGTSYSTIASIPADMEMKLIEKYSLFWYKVEINGMEGYVRASYLIPVIEEDEPEEEIPEPEVPDEPPAEEPPAEEPPTTDTPEEEEPETETPGENIPPDEDEEFDIVDGSIPMYRLYNPNSGEHFYTGSKNERDYLCSIGWQYEGVAFNSPVAGGKPVYRLYNPNSGDHHYTVDVSEKDMLISVGWQYEGVAFNSADQTGVPQYRLWNKNADLGSHHYTSSEEEMNYLLSLGWVYEGIGWYSLIK